MVCQMIDFMSKAAVNIYVQVLCGHNNFISLD